MPGGFPGTIDTLEMDCNCTITSSYVSGSPLVIDVTDNDTLISSVDLSTRVVFVASTGQLTMETGKTLYFNNDLVIDGILSGNVVSENPNLLTATQQTITGTGLFNPHILSTGTQNTDTLTISVTTHVDSLFKIEPTDQVVLTDTLTLKADNGDNAQLVNDGVGSLVLNGGFIHIERSFNNLSQFWVITTVSDTITAGEYMTSNYSIIWTNHNHDTWDFGSDEFDWTNAYLWDEFDGWIELIDTAQVLYPRQALYSYHPTGVTTFEQTCNETYTDDVVIALDYSATLPSHGYGQGLNRIGNPTYTTISTDGINLLGCDNLIYKYSENTGGVGYTSIDQNFDDPIALASGEGFLVRADGSDPTPTATVLHSAQIDSTLTITRSRSTNYHDVLSVNITAMNGYMTNARAIYDPLASSDLNTIGILNDSDFENELGAPNIRIEYGDDLLARCAFEVDHAQDTLPIQLRTPFATGESFILTLTSLGTNDFHGQCINLIDHFQESKTELALNEEYAFLGSSDTFERRFSIVFSDFPSARISEIPETLCLGETTTIVTESESEIAFYLNGVFQTNEASFQTPNDLDAGLYTITVEANQGCGVVTVAELPLTVESCLAISENSGAKLYWYASENTLTIQWEKYASEPWSYTLFTSTGQRVKTQDHINEDYMTVPLQSGLYILNVRSGINVYSQLVIIR